MDTVLVCNNEYCQKGRLFKFENELSRAISYEEYWFRSLKIIKNRVEHLSESFVQYTRINVQRMKRWDKQIKISSDLYSRMTRIEDEIIFLAITETWCGDAAHSLPLFHKLEALNPKISFKILYPYSVPVVL